MRTMTMRTIGILVVAGLAMLLSGCVWSVHPLYTEETVVFEPALVGVWATADGEKIAIVKEGKDKNYEVTYQQKDLSEGASGKYNARLVRLGEYLFLDVYPDKKAVDTLMEAKPVWYLLPTHTFYRVQLNGDAVTVSLVDDELVTKSEPSTLAHEEIGAEDGENGYLLTASSAELQAGLAKRAGDEKIYLKLGEFRRLK